jgi:hypothetical protein
MANDGLMAPSAFRSAGPDQRGTGVNPWQHRGPAEVPADPAPAAAPPAADAPGLLEQVAGGGTLGADDLGRFEVLLNRAIGAASTQQAAGAPALTGLGWQRPAATAPPDPAELARQMRQAEERLASGGRRDAPSAEDVDRLVEGFNALARSDPRTWQPAPEKGTLAARVRDLEQSAQGELDPAAAHALDGEIGELFGELNAEVHAADAAADVFEGHGPQPLQVDEALFERARTDPRNLSAAEAGSFEAMLNARVAELGRNPQLSRPALPEPAPTKPAGQAGADPLANVDPAVLLKAIERLNVTPEQLAGLVAGGDSEEGAAS